MTAEDIEREIVEKEAEPVKEYVYPPISLLKKGKNTGGTTEAHLRETAAKISRRCINFGVNVTITNISCGPTVTVMSFSRSRSQGQ